MGMRRPSWSISRSIFLGEQAQREALGRLELTDLWGIAGRLAERRRAIGIPITLVPEALNYDWHSLEESASDNHMHHDFRQLEPAPIGYIFGAYLVDRERNQ
jgi:hypothetical protein